MTSEGMKVPEDLKYTYELASMVPPNGTGMWDDALVVRLIERVAKAESEQDQMREALQAEKDKPAKILPRLVVCAVIVRDGMVLLERRAPAGVAGLDNMWDLPGGKVEPGEPPEDAIVREIAEELSIGIRPLQLLPYLPTSTWKYADGEQRHWILAAYPCDIISGEPVCTDTLRWFHIGDALRDKTVLEADRRLIALAARAALSEAPK